MPILPQNIETLIAAEKRLTFKPRWDARSNPRSYEMTVPLVTGGVAVGGFQLRARVSKTMVARDAMAQLEFSLSRRNTEPLSRAEWRPFSIHTNPLWGPPGHEAEDIVRKTHIHLFEHNFFKPEHRMRRVNLPAAIPIDPDPRTLSDFLAFCGERFRIANIDIIEVPDVTQDMLWTPEADE